MHLIRKQLTSTLAIGLGILMMNRSSGKILQDISMTIETGQKIGVCGRTGRYVKCLSHCTITSLTLVSM